MHRRVAESTALVAFSICAGLAFSAEPGATRPVTVVDSIEMTHIGEPWGDILGIAPVSFSPNGRQFVTIVRKGNVVANVNEYSLLWFATEQAFRQPAPKVLTTVASTSNQPGISDVRWLDDNTLLFLEAQQDDPQQVVSLTISTEKATRLTNHPTDVMAFDSTSGLGTVAYIARPRTKSYWNERTEREGLVISDQYVGDLLTGHPWKDDDAGVLSALNVYMQDSDGPLKLLDMGDYKPFGAVSVSPNGQWAIMRAWVTKDEVLSRWSAFKEAMGPDRSAAIYLVADKHTNTVKPLIDAPVAEYLYPNLAWTSNSTVVVVNTHLPISETSGGDPEGRFTAEIDVTTGRATRVASGAHRLIRWDGDGKTLCLRSKRDHLQLYPNTDVCDKGDLKLRKGKVQWEPLRTAAESESHRIQVVIDQGLNTPPRLMVHDLPNKKPTLLFDPNPQFRGLRFAEVEEIQWRSTDGESYIGGLYLPLDFTPGKRYPLVIQTHGWTRNQFATDGVSSAGYAAQALAGKGFVVAQLPDADKWEGSPEEGSRYMAMHEGVVQYLDARGLIDVDRMGILGWSRTGFHVRYTLTFSQYKFAGAVIADGMDASYGQYLSYLNIGAEATDVYEAINGSPPFGEGLRQWFKVATGFNLDKVETPVRLLTFVPSVLLNNWEWFAGLKHLRKPVEHVWLPRAAHAPVRPSERMIAQQGSVDWFAFWLIAEEDPDPSKAEQYQRWRELRTLQKAQDSERVTGNMDTSRVP